MKIKLSRSFDIDLWDGPIEDQKHSGRCWIYASLNPLRQKLCEQLGRKDFRFSTNYIFYFDQLEKSKAFLERVDKLRGKPLNDPVLSELLRMPVSSVGQWCYFALLAEQYGVVPQEIMPDTVATADGSAMTHRLSEALRSGAYRIRHGEESAEETTLKEISSILQDALGTFPKYFEWESATYTPQDFLRNCCNVNFADYVTLIHHPTERWKSFCAYHEEICPSKRHPYLTMLSVDMETMKNLTLCQLRDGEQVVIGCDVRHAGNRAAGELSTEKYGAPLFRKGDAIAYREIYACHVMSIDGWAQDGRWKVQDSHGVNRRADPPFPERQSGKEGTGPDGHYVMTDAWFDAYVLSAVVQKKYLPENLRILLKQSVYMPKTERF